MNKTKKVPLVALASLLSSCLLAGCGNTGGGTSTNTGDTGNQVELKLNKAEVSLPEIGAKETVTLSVKGNKEAPKWESTDDEAVKLTPSADGLSCEIENTKGGNAVVTASADGVSADLSVKASTYGDLRKTYEVHKADGSKVEEVKGLWNAIGKLNANSELKPGETAPHAYVTAKDSEEKLYVRDKAWATLLDKDNGTCHELDGVKKTLSGVDVNATWENGKTAWFPSYQLLSDVLKKGSTVFTVEGNKKFSTIDARPTDFSSSLFADGAPGYNGDPTKNVWSGWRASKQTDVITGAQYVSWADGNAMNWDEISLTLDLSDSTMTPSYNHDQGAYGQMYIGASYHFLGYAGLYFDAGTMTDTANLAEGATRSIFAFKQETALEGGLISTLSRTNRVIRTTEIAKASWDAFNHAWKFPKVKVDVKAHFHFSDEQETVTNNYYVDYTITGYQNDEKVGTDNFQMDSGMVHKRNKNDHGKGDGERFIYGVSFTPDYGELGHADGSNKLADITCGGKWSNVTLAKASAHIHEGLSGTDDNLSFGIGRTINKGNQTGLYGSDCMTMKYDQANDKTIFDFTY